MNDNELAEMFTYETDDTPVGQPVLQQYGPLRRGRHYKVLESGYDWHKIKYRGNVLYVPFWVFTEENDD